MSVDVDLNQITIRLRLDDAGQAQLNRIESLLLLLTQKVENMATAQENLAREVQETVDKVDQFISTVSSELTTIRADLAAALAAADPTATQAAADRLDGLQTRIDTAMGDMFPPAPAPAPGP